MEHKLLRISTGGTLTSWLFAQRDRGAELGTTEKKSSKWQGGGIKPGILQSLTGTLSTLSINIFTAFCQRAKNKNKITKF